jgi:hypothetical protein
MLQHMQAGGAVIIERQGELLRNEGLAPKR